MLNLHTTKLLLIFVVVFQVSANKLTDEEYALMPPVFYLDDYDHCLMLNKNSLYCTATIQLAPNDLKNQSKTWNIIQEAIRNPKYYRHDKLRHGICIMETCPDIKTSNTSLHELKNEISACYSEKYEQIGLKAIVTELHCESNKPFYEKDASTFLFGIFLFTILFLNIFGSFYEGLPRYKTEEEYEKVTKTKFGKYISCFSLPKNWERLKSISTKPDDISLRALQGMRCYSMMLVIMSHVCMIGSTSFLINPRFIESISDDPSNMVFLNGGCLVQTFFLISGWLLSYHFFLLFEKQEKVKPSYILLAFINRYIRLTPSLLVVVGISSTWLYHINRGPIWDRIVGDEYRNCRQNWWANLLYINNYYDNQHMCLQQTWYLAADTQLFALSLLIITIIWKYQKRVKIILATCLIVACLVPAIINYINNYDIIVRSYPEPLYNLFLNVPQWHHMSGSGYSNFGGYTIGMIFAYLFYRSRNEKIFTGKIHVTLWWILTWTLPLSVILVGIPFYQDEYKAPRLLAALYAGTARNIFALGIAILIFGVTKNVGWTLRDCVLWPPFIILGRLTYCAYLVHILIIRIGFGQTRTLTYMNNYLLFTKSAEAIVISYTFATMLCLFVEMPSSALYKVMVPQLQEKHNSNTTVNHNNDMYTSKV